MPANSVKELIALIEARPGQMGYGSAGNGGVHHLAAEPLRVGFNLDMVHVPYRGMGAVIPELVGGHIPMTFSSVPPSMPYVTAGKLRALAVSSTKRSSVAPEVLTMIEAGVPGFVATNRFAYFVPAGTSGAIVSTLEGRHCAGRAPDPQSRALRATQRKPRTTARGRRGTPAHPG